MLTRFWHLLLLVQFVQCKNLEVREDVPEMQSSMGKSQVNQEFVRKNPRVFFSVSLRLGVKNVSEKITSNFHAKLFLDLNCDNDFKYCHNITSMLHHSKYHQHCLL